MTTSSFSPFIFRSFRVFALLEALSFADDMLLAGCVLGVEADVPNALVLSWARALPAAIGCGPGGVPPGVGSP